METSMTVKGQVVIPADLRRRLGIKKGTRLHVEERDGEIILRPLTRDYFERMSGVLKGAGLVRALEASRREDREKEEDRIAGEEGSG